VTNAVKAVGQHVDEEPADELVGCERHHLEPFVPFRPIVFPFEGDATFALLSLAFVPDLSL
jgi:hypothetical protein